jgi:hypothetical protein
MVDLWDIWLPAENLIVTMSCEGMGKPLRVVEYDGEENGPYHLLGFSDVPNNILPLSPAATWYDLHDLANRVFRKLARQAERQKDVLLVTSGAEEDGKKVLRVNDGEAIVTDDPSAAQQAKFGGIDQVSLAFLLQVKDTFFTFAGNLDAVGGLSPQSRTLGQDEILQANSSQRVQDMQERMINSMKSITKALSWYVWTDPVRSRDVKYRVPGTTVDVNMKWSPETREGDYLQYNFDVNPYSMQASTPSIKLQGLSNTMQQFVLPLIEQIQGQGMEVDMNALINLVSKYADMPELKTIFKTSLTPVELLGPQGSEKPRKAATTTRNIVRQNIPGASRSGKDDVMGRILSGGGVQGSEASTLTRPTSGA